MKARIPLGGLRHQAATKAAQSPPQPQPQPEPESRQAETAEAQQREGVAFCWLPLLCGAAVVQAGLLPLYGDLALWCGVGGGALMLVGAFSLWRYSGLTEDFLGLLGLYVGFGTMATACSAINCPATGTVPAMAINDEGMMVGDWQTPEAAQLAMAELAQSVVRDCTDTCHRQNSEGKLLVTAGDDICQDGGLGSDSSRWNYQGRNFQGYCPLGSDTTDCGCRNGTSIADWLPPLELGREPDTYGWGDRHESGRGCLMAFYMACISLFTLLIALCVACREPSLTRRAPSTRHRQLAAMRRAPNEANRP